MKNLIASVILILFTSQLSANLRTSNNTLSEDRDAIKIDARIDDSIETELLETIEEFANDFFYVSNFKNDEFGFFDLEKYNTFVGFFEGDCQVINDLESKKDVIAYHEYANLVLNHFSDSGLNFKISKFKITSVGIDEAGFYTATLEYSKQMESFINPRGKIKSKKSNHKIIMEINMPDYLISDIRITNIDSARVGIVQSFKRSISQIKLQKIGFGIKNIFKKLG